MNARKLRATARSPGFTQKRGNLVQQEGDLAG